jgi:hypothetical protein
MSQHKANILAVLQHGGGNHGNAAQLRNQASALAQYLQLSTAEQNSKTKRTTHKQKEVKLQLNKESKLISYLRSNVSSTSNSRHRLGGIRVFTVKERMKEAERKHEKRLYNWKIPRRKGKNYNTGIDENKNILANKTDRSENSEGSEGSERSERSERTEKHERNAGTNDMKASVVDAKEKKMTSDSQYQNDLELQKKPFRHIEPTPPSSTAVRNSTFNRMRQYFEHIERGGAGRIGRQHKHRMLHKKQPSKYDSTENTPAPPSNKQHFQLDQETVENSILSYKPKHQLRPQPPSLAKQPRQLQQLHQQQRDPIEQSFSLSDEEKKVSPPGKEKTDLIIKNMKMYFRAMPSPHLFNPVSNFNDLIEENYKLENIQTSKKQEIGNVAGVAKLVSKFHKKLRKRQLINRYSTSKDLSNDEYNALLERSKTFFSIEEHLTERFHSDLVMRFLKKKTKLLRFANDGLQDLINQRDRVAMYAISIYMNDNKMLNRFFRTTERLLREKNEAEEKWKRERIIETPIFDNNIESAISNLLS